MQKHKMLYKIRSDTDNAEYRRQCMNLTKSIKKEKIKWESELEVEGKTRSETNLLVYKK